MRKADAITELYPNVVKTIGDSAYDINDNEISIDLDAVQTLMDSKAYIDDRRKEYPNIGDQLDALFHAGVFPEDMAATIQAIKDKYPKE